MRHSENPMSTATDTTQLSAASIGPSRRKRTTLKETYKAMAAEWDNLSKSTSIDQTTKEGYNNTLSLLSDLCTIRQQIRRSGGSRKRLLAELAEAEGTTFRSVKRGLLDLRNQDGVSRGGDVTRNAELLKEWYSTDRSERSSWSVNDWAKVQSALQTELTRSMRSYDTLQGDIDTLKSILTARKQEETNASGSSVSAKSDKSSVSSLRRLRTLIDLRKAAIKAKRSRRPAKRRQGSIVGKHSLSGYVETDDSGNAAGSVVSKA
ncbi:uncharacterized protein I303_100044 [Kwoniella dejecticola CBS 10117]|uniref:Uncharacterized protein n=1 Tax=Kwoniella dejecticola CBS 10117 TaxID=1296121 RepID=A0A1A6ADW9_9TREE|nr:uncharacterized protein I303_00044 [Kwoniella dejecticola CBS 10117]OBR88233.1 hypothetical protein I303_00044 [Kwoniella dejecticola CBS 10117]